MNTLSVLIFSLFAFVHNFFFGICAKPITFKIVEVDPKFNLSTTSAITYAKSAADLWDKGTGKDLLEYDPNGEIGISFVFDERQRRVIETQILNEKIKNAENLLNQKSQTIGDQQATFNSLKNNYESEVQIFNQRLQIYNQAVEQVNSLGGATREQAVSLEAEKNYLTNKSSELDATRVQLNNFLQNLQNNVDNYNFITNSVNKVIFQANQNASSSFEEGYFEGNKIVLYEYENVLDLKRLLAHELGHALGFDHVDDSKAIMYYLNVGKEFILTNADINEYKRVCMVK